MRIRFNVFSLLAGVLFMSSNLSFSQSVHFSDSLGPYFGSSYYRIIGNIHGNNLVLHIGNENENIQLLVFDSSCRLISKRPLSFISCSGLVKLDVFTNTDSWDVVWQSFHELKHSCFFARLDGSGELLRMNKLIDSASAVLNQNAFNIGVSANHRFYMAYATKYDSMQSKMSFVFYRMDADSSKESNTHIAIQCNPELERFSKPYLDDDGNIYCARYDHPLNYKLGSTLSVFKLGLQGKEFVFPDLYAKQKKPQNPYFYVTGNKLIIGALFTDFYSHQCEGVCCFIYDFSHTGWDSIVYLPFTSAFRKQIHKNIFAISRGNLMNLLQMSGFDAQKENAYTFLIDLECTQYPDRGTDDPRDPRNNNANYNELAKPDENPVQKLGATAYTGAAARNFWGPSYSTYSEPAMAANMSDGNGQNPAYSKGSDAISNQFLRPNPIIRNTILLSGNAGTGQLGYSIVHSQINKGMDDIAPLSSAGRDTLFHFSYQLTPQAVLKLHMIKVSPFGQEMDRVVLNNDPRLLLLHQSNLMDLEGHYLLAFFENNQNHCFGLARLTW